MEALQARRVRSSADILKPGDYCYIEKRPPIITHDMTVTDEPTAFLPRLWWILRGRPICYKVMETSVPQWPDYDCIIAACPHCSQPIGTTKEHCILGVEPLTVDLPIACPYSKPNATAAPTVNFYAKNGTIMPA